MPSTSASPALATPPALPVLAAVSAARRATASGSSAGWTISSGTGVAHTAIRPAASATTRALSFGCHTMASGAGAGPSGTAATRERDRTAGSLTDTSHTHSSPAELPVAM
eukprot:17451-Chlamydomonas_euryale.AAC.1